MPSDQISPEPVSRRRPKLKPLGFLVPYALRYRGRLVLAIIALIAAAAATLAVPLAVRRMIDHGFSSGNASFINSYFAMLIVVAGALAIASAARYYLVTTLGDRMVADIRAAVFRHVVNLSPAFFDRTMSGEVVSRLTADTTQIKAAVGASASQALRNFVLFVGALAMMIFTSPRLSAFALGVIPLIVIPLVLFGRTVRKKSRAAQDLLASSSAYATEAIGSVRALQAFTLESAAAHRYGTATNDAYGSFREATAARASLTFIAIFLVFSSIVGVLWVGAHDVLTGRLTAGSLGQFVLYAAFAAGALGELSSVWGEITQTAGAAERLAQLMAEESEVTDPDRPTHLPTPARGAVAFERVHFHYPADIGAGVLRGVTFRVTPGETVAIVGPSGAGKSTIFNLLLRYYDPIQGEVTVDGINVRDVRLHDLRQRIAIVPQDTTVFAASVRENIRLGRPDATDSEVMEAAEAARVTTFVDEFTNGIDTVIGERGITLSGGQRQRLAIARAILKNAPVLLLDEATSSLDAESERAIQDALQRLMTNRTTLVIAHRLATVTAADRILVLDHGTIVEEGNHESLIAKGGLYARLARLQFDRPVAAGRQAVDDEDALRSDAAE